MLTFRKKWPLSQVNWDHQRTLRNKTSQEKYWERNLRTKTVKLKGLDKIVWICLGN